MATIKIVTVIDAPIEICFDLARDIDFHVRSMAETGERAVAGSFGSANRSRGKPATLASCNDLPPGLQRSTGRNTSGTR